MWGKGGPADPLDGAAVGAVMVCTGDGGVKLKEGSVP